LMSGYAEHPLLDAVHAAGEPCLVKPFEIASFGDTVARLLGEAAQGGSCAEAKASALRLVVARGL
jgi:hypothetical protein